jgi:hypothetical protein
MIPDGIHLEVDIETGDLAVVARASFEAMAATGVPSVTQWCIPVATRNRKKGLHEAIAKLFETDPANRETSLGFDLEAGWSGAIGRPAGNPNRQSLLLMVHLDQERPELPTVVAKFASVCRELLARVPVRWGRARWIGSGALCVPHVPIAETRAQVVVTSVREVDDAYERPEAFWKAWDVREEHGDRTLLIRAVEAKDSVDMLRRSIGPQWEMARAAKPGRVHHVVPSVEPEEESIYLQGDSPLKTVGYLEKEKLVEMSCVLPKNAHIPGWQIHNLLERILSKTVPDGRPLETLRIVFLDRWAAEQEKRPLLDIGAKVYWQGDSGDIVPVDAA